jgi:hypothetical protein
MDQEQDSTVAHSNLGFGIRDLNMDRFVFSNHDPTMDLVDSELWIVGRGKGAGIRVVPSHFGMDAIRYVS